MLTAEARVETERASRYLAQLCRHASQLGQHLRHTHDSGDAPPEVRHVEWSDTYGIVSLGWGEWTDLLPGRPGWSRVSEALGLPASGAGRFDPACIGPKGRGRSPA